MASPWALTREDCSVCFCVSCQLGRISSFSPRHSLPLILKIRVCRPGATRRLMCTEQFVMVSTYLVTTWPVRCSLTEVHHLLVQYSTVAPVCLTVSYGWCCLAMIQIILCAIFGLFSIIFWENLVGKWSKCEFETHVAWGAQSNRIFAPDPGDYQHPGRPIS